MLKFTTLIKKKSKVFSIAITFSFDPIIGKKPF
jgi:hypothetical protein